MLNRFWNWLSTSVKKGWAWLLNQTTVDEKVVEVVEEVKEDIEVIRARAKRVAEETRDVLEAAKEVGKQAKDVVEAAKGAPRKGRKPAPRRKPAAKKPAAEVKEAAKKPTPRKRNNRKPAAKK